MLRRYGIGYLITLAYLGSQSVFAAVNLPPSPSFAGQVASLLESSFVGSLSIGPAFASGGKTQTLTLAPQVEKTYIANKPANTLANLEILLGIQQPVSQNLQGQIGLDFAVASSAKLSGNIWDDASPLFNNYTYQYQLNHTQLGLKGRLTVDRGSSFMPWVSLMVGVAFNQASNFTNTPLIFEALPSSNFSQQTATSLTYGFGIGVQRALAKHWQAGVGYEWVDWGKSQLGGISGSATNQSISISHFYTNAVMFNITFLASEK